MEESGKVLSAISVPVFPRQNHVEKSQSKRTPGNDEKLQAVR